MENIFLFDQSIVLYLSCEIYSLKSGNMFRYIPLTVIEPIYGIWREGKLPKRRERYGPKATNRNSNSEISKIARRTNFCKVKSKFWNLANINLTRHSAIIGIPFWKLRKFSNSGLPDLIASLANVLAKSFVCFSVIFHARQVDGKRTKQR